MNIEAKQFETLHVVPFVEGWIANNTYAVFDEESHECVIIDPSFSFDRILSKIKEAGYEPKEYWLTHGHYDHIIGTAYPDVISAGIPSRIHPLDEPLIHEAEETIAKAFPFIREIPAPNYDLADGMILSVGKYEFKTLHTPGHAPGHCCFYCEKAGWLFSGDLVFYQSYGRTDLTGGNEAVLMKSIREKILTLPPETLIMPGHEDYTTVGDEKRFY